MLVVFDVVLQSPQAIGVKRRKKAKSANQVVDPTALGQGLMAGIMADHEKLADAETRKEAENNIQGWRSIHARSKQASQVKHGLRNKNSPGMPVRTLTQVNGRFGMNPIKERGVAVHVTFVFVISR